MDLVSSEVRRLEQELAAHRRSFRAPAVAVWTPPQTGHSLHAIAGHRWYALYHLIAFRRLRRGEAVGLTWVHADLDGADLTVSAQIVQLGYATEQATPKVDSHGVVALDSGTDRVLREHRERQRREAASWGLAWHDSGLVLTREDGAALHPELVSRTFERLVRDARLPPIRLHALRHGAARWRWPAREHEGGIAPHAAALFDHDHRRHVHLGAAGDGPARRRSSRRDRPACSRCVRPGRTRPVRAFRSHTAPETTLGSSFEQEEPSPGAVRRQGLEAGTRG